MQTGSRNRKQYRIVAVEESKRRDGKVLENLGFYNPLIKPPEIIIQKDRVEHWISKGAQMTEAVIKLVNH